MWLVLVGLNSGGLPHRQIKPVEFQRVFSFLDLRDFFLDQLGGTIMYLSKNASGTYYTRLPQPKSLRDLGLPFAIRTSLCTKDRQLAVDRNLAVAARTRALIAATPADTTPRSFYRWIRADLDAFKAAGFIPPQTPSTPREPSVDASAVGSRLPTHWRDSSRLKLVRGSGTSRWTSSNFGSTPSSPRPKVSKPMR